MSEPSSIPPNAYSIDPDRQCGVLKSDGNRCNVRLNCLLHNDAEKNAIPRSKTYKQLLKLRPPSLALDSRPRLGVILLPPSDPNRPVAWISDPNVHCSVPLAESSGLPCQADIATCANHFPEQMSLVQGRCASVYGIRRVLKANRDAGQKKGVPFDADIHCGVSKSDGKQCTRNLSCSYHDNAAKRAVPRNTGFRGRYLELLGLQLALLPEFESLVPTRSSEVAKNVVDTSVQCGVRGNKTCSYALNCSTHSEGSKLKILQNAELETLLHRQSPMSATTDRYCGALLPDGESCGNDFECGVHTLADQKQETREGELKAGEAASNTGEAALKAEEAHLADDKLRNDDMRTREASLREEELAARKTRLADDRMRDDSTKAREARLLDLQEREFASREARLADEGVRDARMAATMKDTLKALKAELAAELEKRTQETVKALKAELATQLEKRTQETVKALKAESAAQLEKRTQEMQNERDLALSNTRAQRDAIFQSIRDLKTSLRDRSAAYHHELAGIATHIDNATAQIQALQGSAEGLRLQRDNVASRYQADKAQIEEEIDGLQEKITALLG
jgi:hypothetical protein